MDATLSKRLVTNAVLPGRIILPVQAAQTQEIEYDVKFDDVLLRIAAKRCQVRGDWRDLE